MFFFNRSMMSLATGVALLGSIAVATIAHAMAPELVHYQGFLRDSDGLPIDGPTALEFRIFDLATDGVELWVEVHDGVVVSDGIFHVVLGSFDGLPASVFDGGERWLETSVEGFAVLPRRQFLSTPFAMRAAVADVALSGGEADNDWEMSGNNIWHETGSVSIGTAQTTTQALNIGGDFQTGGAAANYDGNSEFMTLRGRSGDWVFGVQNETTEGATDFYIGQDFTEDGIFHIQRDGRVGFGTSSPGAELHVYEDVDVSAELILEKAAGSVLALRANVSSASMGTTSAHDVRFVTDNAVRMHLGTDGNIGMGTTTPTSKLTVNGTVESRTGGFKFPDGSTQTTAAASSVWQPNGSEIYYDSGNVGIGTDNPAAKLHVEGGAIRLADSSGGVVGILGENSEGSGYVQTRGDNGLANITLNSPIGLPTHGYLAVHGEIPATTAQAAIYVTSLGNGRMELRGPNGKENIVMSSYTGYPDHGYIHVDDSASATQAGMYVDANGDGVLFADTKNFRMDNPSDPNTEIWYACPEGPEAAAYLRGTATLNGGVAEISFPQHFFDVASPDGITVQVTPHSAESVGLAVVERSPSGIVVRELGSGTGSYEFDYYVMAVRKGHESYEVVRPKVGSSEESVGAAAADLSN